MTHQSKSIQELCWKQSSDLMLRLVPCSSIFSESPPCRIVCGPCDTINCVNMRASHSKHNMSHQWRNFLLVVTLPLPDGAEVLLETIIGSKVSVPFDDLSSRFAVSFPLSAKSIVTTTLHSPISSSGSGNGSACCIHPANADVFKM